MSAGREDRRQHEPLPTRTLLNQRCSSRSRTEPINRAMPICCKAGFMYSDPMEGVDVYTRDVVGITPEYLCDHGWTWRTVRHPTVE